MKFWKIVGVFFIAVGVLFFIFLRMLSDPEVEGASGEVSLGEYSISLIPIGLGIMIILLDKSNKKSV